jgi:hypothetical protein
MGAIALHSGGLLVDHGWLRILGAGHPRIGGGLREWNGLGGHPSLDPPLGGALLVAYDAVGGFYAINGGGLPGSAGGAVYFSPDTYDVFDLEMGYSQFVQFACSGDLDRFYTDLRWPGWENDVETLGPDRVLTFQPFLGVEETLALGDRARAAVPAREAWYFFHTMSKGLRDLPPDAKVEIKFT